MRANMLNIPFITVRNSIIFRPYQLGRAHDSTALLLLRFQVKYSYTCSAVLLPTRSCCCCAALLGSESLSIQCESKVTQEPVIASHSLRVCFCGGSVAAGLAFTVDPAFESNPGYSSLRLTEDGYGHKTCTKNEFADPPPGMRHLYMYDVSLQLMMRQNNASKAGECCQHKPRSSTRPPQRLVEVGCPRIEKLIHSIPNGASALFREALVTT